MSLFKFPKTICDGINSVLSKYWWGKTWNGKKIFWINWGKLCGLKKKGGMKFWDIHVFNLAMLAKQAWRLIRETHSLFYRVYKARYFYCCSFMEAELGSNLSMVWRSLLQACNVIREGSVWEVGDGRSIGISSHKWLPHPPCFRDEADQDLRECDLINKATHQWDQSILAATFTWATVEDILRIRVDTLNTRDKLTWKANKPREFTVKTA